MAAAKRAAPTAKTAAKRPKAKTAPVKTPRVPNQPQAARMAAKGMGPAPKTKKAAKNTVSPPKKGTKPRARSDQSRLKPGAVVPNYQGSAPTAGGSMGFSGFGG